MRTIMGTDNCLSGWQIHMRTIMGKENCLSGWQIHMRTVMGAEIFFIRMANSCMRTIKAFPELFFIRMVN